ncbi:uncharacterized protein LOC128792941 [Vidua chalybeata]|uniref:uncharacterized protein LOC128792941 n=1 Tax=Vidua chalybeata TaxID=81927 RepID=UPI0023A8F231|nr:uncharacterized protein LOC128792941 [Vidua chalybeata]
MPPQPPTTSLSPPQPLSPHHLASVPQPPTDPPSPPSLHTTTGLLEPEGTLEIIQSSSPAKARSPRTGDPGTRPEILIHLCETLNCRSSSQDSWAWSSTGSKPITSSRSLRKD